MEIPLDVWCHVVSFLKTPKEICAISSALNTHAYLFIQDNTPHHLRHKIIPMAVLHDRKDIFRRAVSLGFDEQFYDRLLSLIHYNKETKEERVSHVNHLRKACTWKKMWWYEFYIHHAIEKGWLDIVKWFHNQGCPLVRNDKKLNVEELTLYAARGGHFDVLMWLIRKGCPCRAGIYAYAQTFGGKRIVQWFERKEVMGDFLEKHNYMRGEDRRELYGYTVSFTGRTT